MSRTITRVRAGEWERYREIRHRALADSPLAFGTTLAESLERPDSFWQERARVSEAGETDMLVVAVEDGVWIGLTGVYLADDVPNRASIVSVWVDPAQRRRGIARDLVEWAIAWAQVRGCREAELWVTASNLPARLLYRNMGFVDTGQRQPLRWDQSVVQAQMVRSIPS